MSKNNTYQQVPITIRVSDSLRIQLNDAAAKKGQSISKFIRKAITNELNPDKEMEIGRLINIKAQALLLGKFDEVQTRVATAIIHIISVDLQLAIDKASKILFKPLEEFLRQKKLQMPEAKYMGRKDREGLAFELLNKLFSTHKFSITAQITMIDIFLTSYAIHFDEQIIQHDSVLSSKLLEYWK